MHCGGLEIENPPTPAPTLPGISNPVTGTYTGTHTIELGEPPENATHIDARLTCLSAGTLTLEDGFEVNCQSTSGSTTAQSSYKLAPGQRSITVTAAEPATKYTVIAVYQDGPSVR